MYNYDYKKESDARLNNLIIELNMMDGKHIEEIFDKFYKKLDEIKSKEVKSNEQ